MAEQAIKGFLLLKRDSLVFQSNTGQSKESVDRLKNLDFELFEKEISKYENHSDFQSTIDLMDVFDVKLLMFDSMDSKDDSNEDRV